MSARAGIPASSRSSTLSRKWACALPTARRQLRPIPHQGNRDGVVVAGNRRTDGLGLAATRGRHLRDLRRVALPSERAPQKDAGFLKADIKEGEFFILGGQTAYIAEVGEPIRAPNGEFDARLRVIYSNATESNLLLRSALYKDETSRRVSESTAGPLFSAEADDSDLASGTIYVLRSKSDHPVVAANRDILHKIGVTGGDVGRRIANAKLDPTFLMADVEIVASYELYNISRTKLENVIHRVFDPARLDIEIKDRFGNPVIPREWFLVPVFVVDEAVERIKDGTITNYTYDPKTASLTE
jgi:T5orf172 domain